VFFHFCVQFGIGRLFHLVQPSATPFFYRKKGVAEKTIEAQSRQIFELTQWIWALKKELDNLYERTKDFFRAVKLAPQRVQELFADIFSRRKEEVAQKQSKWNVKRSGRDAR